MLCCGAVRGRGKLRASWCGGDRLRFCRVFDLPGILGFHFLGFLIAERTTQHFTHHGFGEFFTELENARHLVGCQLLAAKRRQFGDCEFFTWFGDNIGFERFAA